MSVTQVSDDGACDECDGKDFGADMRHNCFEDVTHKNGETEATQVFECPCCHAERRRLVRIPTVVYRAMKVPLYMPPRDDPLFEAVRAIREGEGALEGWL